MKPLKTNLSVSLQRQFLMKMNVRIITLSEDDISRMLDFGKKINQIKNLISKSDPKIWAFLRPWNFSFQSVMTSSRSSAVFLHTKDSRVQINAGRKGGTLGTKGETKAKMIIPILENGVKNYQIRLACTCEVQLVLFECFF